MEFSPESQHDAPPDCREGKKKDRKEKPGLGGQPLLGAEMG